MKLKKFFFIILFVFSFFILFHTSVYAGDLELNSLKYDVTLNTDGTALVTEYWDIDIDETNTLFKTFEIDKAKYSGIENVSLVETTNGTRTNFRQIYSEKYHVDKNCFYALVNSKNQFEIAWGVHEDDSFARRKFEISYTIVDAVKNYSDCSEFYWQFISNESAIPAKKVTGSITLPSNVEKIDDLLVWAHGPLNGNIYRTSNNLVSFSVDNLNSRTMLEARVVTPTYIFSDNTNVSSSSRLNYILNQEQQWADEANKLREKKAFEEKMVRFFLIVLFCLTNLGGIFLAIFLIKKIKKYKVEFNNAPNFVPEFPSKYFRDIPDENSTPSQAAYLYYFKKSVVSIHIPDVISATMLDLCLKKYLNFEVSGNNKKDITIILNSNLDANLLSKDEKLIYEMFSKISSDMKFTMQDFEKYCKKHSDSFMKDYNKIEKYALEEIKNKGKYDSKLINTYSSWVGKGVGFIFLSMVSIIFMFASIIPAIICAVYAFKISARYNTLTQKGTDEKEQWNGLKNYMEDFSLLKEKEVPELILWEKYLVYATAFGISDKVLKQLKVVYPQFNDSDYMTSSGYSYLYWMSYGNFSNNFIHNINNSISSAYTSINYSSGSGSGGGFSGGGGFGGGGGRNGRKIVFLVLQFL